MKNKFLKINILLLSLFITLELSAEIDFWSNLNDEILLEKIYSSMSDKQKLGQLMLFGYMGEIPSNDILNWIGQNEIGGVKIFGWNVGSLKQCAKSIAKMQETSQKTSFKIPLFIVTDQEGGWVRHIHRGTSETSGNMSLAASRIPEDSFKTGFYIGMELHKLGINMNFAPTVDVYSNKEAHVIGPRAFSDDPVVTASLSSAYFKGMDEAGIICTAKHYPGHGDADKDSHGAMPIINADFQTLWERDLLPYRYLVKEDLPAIMSGHLAFPQIADNKTPASISKYFLTDLLRDKMGFKGLIITDDIVMNGVQHLPFSTAEICKKAIMAGNDIILLSRTSDLQKEVWEYLLRELTSDEEFKSRVYTSCIRILKTKLKYLKGENSVPLFPDYEKIDKLVPSKQASDFFFDQALRSVTLLRKSSQDSLVPKGKILLAGQYERFFTEGKKKFPKADSFYFDYSPFYTSSEDVIKRLKTKATQYDTIIFCLANPNSADVLNRLKNISSKIIVVSVLTPIYLLDIYWVKNAIAIYGTSVDAFKAGFAVLSGEILPQGKIPFEGF